MKSPSEEENSSEFSSTNSKVISIKMEELPNDSCAELKKTSWERSTYRHTHATGQIQENVTLGELEGYFPMVYGHFAVATGLSIMYTPYGEQSIACLLYVLLSVPLLVCNARRHNKCTVGLWVGRTGGM